MIEINTDFAISLISGVIAGLILLLGQFIVELYDQKYNVLLIAAICFILVVIVLLASAKRVKSKSKK